MSYFLLFRFHDGAVRLRAAGLEVEVLAMRIFVKLSIFKVFCAREKPATAEREVTPVTDHERIWLAFRVGRAKQKRFIELFRLLLLMPRARPHRIPACLLARRQGNRATRGRYVLYRSLLWHSFALSVPRLLNFRPGTLVDFEHNMLAIDLEQSHVRCNLLRRGLGRKVQGITEG